MPDCSGRVRIGDVDYESRPDGPWNVLVNGQPLTSTVNEYVQLSKVFVADAFDKDSKEIRFVSQIETICFTVFNTIKQIKQNNGSEVTAALLASRLYESFTEYWIGLLLRGLDVIGIQLWKNVLAITSNWEIDNKPLTIHKGTPYFFLAENYLLVGDKDMAFLYLYNAFLDDVNLGKLAPSLDYPRTAPSYLTITMRASEKNHLYPFVEKLRILLCQYIYSFNLEYFKSFSIHEFDDKFLGNKDLRDIVSFFVFNFVYLFEFKRYGSAIDLSNELLRLRNLDLFFNFSLVIDKTLELAEKNNGSIVDNDHYLGKGIIWISEHQNWMSETDLKNLWGSSNLDLRNSAPDDIIPRLLLKKEYSNNNPIRKEIRDLLIAIKCRNYGGHNIKQQNCLTNQFDDIIQSLLNSLFMIIEVL